MLTGKNRKQNLDRHGNKEQIKPLDLKAVDPVMMQSQSGQWTSGFVRDLHPTKVAYVIQSKGRRYRRNRKSLRPPRVHSNSVSRDDVPAFTNVTLRSNTTQSTNDISTTPDIQPSRRQLPLARVKPPAKKPVSFPGSGRCVKLPAGYCD